jgi:ferritin-like metal-binding protein YciE
MTTAAQDEKLRAGFDEHRRQTETQIERLDKVFKSIGETAREKKCEAIGTSSTSTRIRLPWMQD